MIFLPLACAWYCGVGTLAALVLIFYLPTFVRQCHRRFQRRRWLVDALYARQFRLAVSASRRTRYSMELPSVFSEGEAVRQRVLSRILSRVLKGPHCADPPC